jgi:hypothetical protein
MIATAAVALKLVGKAPTQEAAPDQARTMWTARAKAKYGRWFAIRRSLAHCSGMAEVTARSKF